MYFLDTNICIFALNQRPGHERLARRLDGLERGTVGISSISVAELQFGVHASQRPQGNMLRLERFLAEFDVMAFDLHATRIYGRVRAHLKSLGTPIGHLDMLIGAHTLSAGAVLVTNNVSEFRRVPGLLAEDWTEEAEY